MVIIPWWLFIHKDKEADGFLMDGLLSIKLKDWILIGVMLIIMSVPLFAIIRQTALADQHFEWSMKAIKSNSITTDEWVDYDDYVNMKRVFFIGNWELPDIE